MSRAKERKIKMLLMIGFAVLSTSSLAVASYAWFTSNTTSTATFTQLKVDTGLIYTFYAYNGNFAGGNPANNVTGFTESHPTGTFASNYTEITESNQSKCTTFNGMWPGQKLSFAIHLQNITTDYIGVDVNSFTSTYDSVSQVKIPDVEAVKTVDMAWAIDLYATSTTASTDYISFIEDETLGGTLDDNIDIDIGTTVDSTVRSTTRHIITNSSVSTTELYVFYTVVFSNDPETYLVRTDSTFEDIEPASQTPTHYYIPHSTQGDSNAYIGLGFCISQLTITEVAP